MPNQGEWGRNYMRRNIDGEQTADARELLFDRLKQNTG